MNISEYQKAKKLKKQGQLGAAITAYRKAIEMNPNFYSYHHELGEVFAEKGDWEGAIASYQKAIELKPKSAWSHHNLAEAFAQTGKHGKAIASYRQAIELNPKYAGFYSSLAGAFYQQGKLYKAVNWYSKAVEINPNLSTAYVGLAEVLVKQGKVEEAASNLEKALKISPESGEIKQKLAEIKTEVKLPTNRKELTETETLLHKSLEQLAETHNVLNDSLEKHRQSEEILKNYQTELEKTKREKEELQEQLRQTETVLQQCLEQLDETEEVLNQSVEKLLEKKKQLEKTPTTLRENKTPQKLLKVTWIVSHLETVNGKLYSPKPSNRYRALIAGQLLRESTKYDLNFVVPSQVFNDKTINEKLLQVDVVVISKIFTEEGFKIAKTARKLGAKVVVDYCDNQFKANKYYQKFADKSDLIVVTNQFMADIVKEYTKKDSLIIPDPYEGNSGEPFFEPQDDILQLLWFGSDANFDTLISLLPDLANFSKTQPLKLQVVTKRDNNLIKILQDSKIDYLFEEWSILTLQEALKKCDLVIIPSFIDAKNKKSVKSPNRLIESIRAGRMVVAYPLPSYQEFSNFVKLSKNLIEGLSWVLENKLEITERIKQGQSYIEKNYSPTKIANSWENIFLKITEKNKIMTSNKPLKLNLGCGNKILKGYTNVDVVQTRQGKQPDVTCDIRRLSIFPDDRADEILAVHVVEHFWRWEVGEILSEWVRVLKPGGKMVLECPNILTASSNILNNPKLVGPGNEAAATMWVLYGDPQWKDPLMCHRWGYTPKSLAGVMREIGLVNVRQEPAQYKAREPRDMRIVAEKPESWVNKHPMSDTLKNLSATADATSVENALQFYQSGNYEKARSICHNLLDTDPNNSEALLLLGKIDYQVKKTAKTPVADPPLAYHLWYYDTKIWKTTSWAGIRTLKSPSDMWNYQEIICSLKPSFIIEFGARFGGSALFFAALMKQISPRPKVFSVDIDLDSVSDLTKQEPIIELMAASSASPEVAKRITELREEYPGPVFAILDSDHSKSHVLKEMLLLRPLLKSGDYVVVEDSNINGHPVRPGWGDGPFEAVQEYFEKYPNDYEIDRGREQKFGFTFATNGFLKRVNNC